jgi:hypothetical protein
MRLIPSAFVSVYYARVKAGARSNSGGARRETAARINSLALSTQGETDVLFAAATKSAL